MSVDTGPGDTTVDPLPFNPFDPEFRANPYPTYQRLVREEPVSPLPVGVALSRYDHCLAVLRDPRSSSDFNNATVFQGFAPEVPEEIEARRPFLFRDPPDHTRLRGLVSKAFTPRRIEQLRARAAELTTQLLDAVADKGEMDVIEDLAYPLPVRIISEMLGVPPEDHETFKEWSRQLARGLDPEIMLPADELERRRRTIFEFHDYFKALIAERRRDPHDDLLSALVAVEEQGDVLTEDELLGTLTLLLVAGHETTVNLIANGTLALLRNPDQLADWRADPSIGRSAVEEILRYDPPVQLTGRIPLDDIELDGITLKKGSLAMLLVAAANRDPRRFDEPDRLNLRREDNSHLAFGFGAHYCLGNALARLEGQEALSALIRRFPNLQLTADTLEYKENLVLRGLAALPVRF